MTSAKDQISHPSGLHKTVLLKQLCQSKGFFCCSYSNTDPELLYLFCSGFTEKALFSLFFLPQNSPPPAYQIIDVTGVV